MKKNNFIFFVICILIFTSCVVDDQCRENKRVEMKLDAFHVVANKTRDTIKTTSLTIDSLTVRGLKYDNASLKYFYVDSILFNNSKIGSSTFNLPLQKFDSISKYVITFNKTTDTVTVKHKNSTQYLSLECGCLIVHTIDTVLTTNHFIDSIRISNHIVNATNAENIRIYK